MTKPTTTSPRRRRTEAERAQERYDLAVRTIDNLTARLTALAKDIEAIDAKLDEARAVRNSYATFPGVVAEHPSDVDPAQTSIYDALDEETLPEGDKP